MLYSVQALRTIAALWVFFFHFAPTFRNAGGWEPMTWLPSFGASGVPMFFVIAGFVMVWTTRGDAPAGRFIWRRAVRIYGGYLPIALAFLAFKAATGDINHFIPGGIDILGSLTLTQPDAQRLLIYPTWTLPYELLFYAVFGASLWAGKRRFLMAFFALCGVVVCVGTTGVLGHTASQLLVNPINIGFLVGVVVGLYLIDGHKTNTAAMLAISAAFLVGGFAVGATSPSHIHWIVFATAFFLLGAVPIDAVLRRNPAIRSLAWLGDASFAIYLLHAPIMYVTSTLGLVGPVAYYTGPYGISAAMLTSVLAASILYYWLVERPIIRLGRSAEALFTRPSERPQRHRQEPRSADPTRQTGTSQPSS